MLNFFKSSSRVTINPYRHGLNTIATRLLWDARPESWISRRKLIKLRNTHLGRKCVVVCNGPSLLKTNLNLIESVPSFGLNKINLLFSSSPFRPSFIVSVNPFVIDQNRNFFNTTDIPLFLDSEAINHIKPRENIIFLHSASQPKFARDCSISIQQGYTVTYVALQLAYHMGFRNVAIVGCDHNFATKGPANKTVVSGQKDESHFDPRYFSGGMHWQLPDLVASEYYYSMAQSAFQSDGGNIFNCTEGGNLELFPRIPLAEFINL